MTLGRHTGMGNITDAHLGHRVNFLGGERGGGVKEKKIALLLCQGQGSTAG